MNVMSWTSPPPFAPAVPMAGGWSFFLLPRNSWVSAVLSIARAPRRPLSRAPDAKCRFPLLHVRCTTLNSSIQSSFCRGFPKISHPKKSPQKQTQPLLLRPGSWPRIPGCQMSGSASAVTVSVLGFQLQFFGSGNASISSVHRSPSISLYKSSYSKRNLGDEYNFNASILTK